MTRLSCDQRLTLRRHHARSAGSPAPDGFPQPRGPGSLAFRRLRPARTRRAGRSSSTGSGRPHRGADRRRSSRVSRAGPAERSGHRDRRSSSARRRSSRPRRRPRVDPDGPRSRRIRRAAARPRRAAGASRVWPANSPRCGPGTGRGPSTSSRSAARQPWSCTAPAAWRSRSRALLAAANIGRVTMHDSGDVHRHDSAPGGLLAADEGRRFNEAAHDALRRAAPGVDTRGTRPVRTGRPGRADRRCAGRRRGQAVAARARHRPPGRPRRRRRGRRRPARPARPDQLPGLRRPDPPRSRSGLVAAGGAAVHARAGTPTRPIWP